MKTIYEALDGKIFTTEYDCMNYERKLKLKILSKDVLGLDDNGKPVEMNEGADVFFRKVYFLYVKTDEAAKLIQDDYGDIARDGKKGKFFYDENSGDWVNLKEYRQKTYEKLALLDFVLDVFS